MSSIVGILTLMSRKKSYSAELSMIFYNLETRPRGYKTFFMLNSIEHEILTAHKYKKYQEILHFSGSDKLRTLFFMLIMLKCQQLLAF